MQPEQEQIAKRAAACKGWRWMPGMRQLVASNRAPYRVVCDGYAPPEDEFFVMSECGDPEVLPDLTDPATLGCLLALVREAWGTAIIVSYSYDDGLWETMWEGATAAGWCGRGASEAEALVAALEAAP
jgi:hypothetical protein